LAKAVPLGVKVVQFCDNLPLTRLTARELDEFAAFAGQNQLAIEIGTRGIGADNLLAHLELARRFLAPFVRVVVDAKGDEPTPAETITRLRPLVARCREAGVKLALENHDRFSCQTLAQIVEALGREQTGICLDTVNSFGALEGPEVVVNILAPYTLNLHVKDFTIQRLSSQMGFTVAGCAAGQGRLNVPWLLDKLRAAGRDVNAIIELWTPLGASLEETIQREERWAAESVRYLRQFITE
jgi:sugar phosphate isomerase/epimerase